MFYACISTIGSPLEQISKTVFVDASTCFGSIFFDKILFLRIPT